MKTYGIRSCLGMLLLSATAGLPGCSSNDGGGDPKASAKGIVRGRVTVDGAPLAKVAVVFMQLETAFGTNVNTNEKGEYEIRSYDGKGLPPGNYKVAVQPAENYFNSADEQGKALWKGRSPAPTPSSALIPVRYQKIETSGLAIEVVSGDNPPFDFDLKSGK